jgi:hypothetical protein
LGHTFEDSVETLRALLETNKSSKDYDLTQNMGFKTGFNVMGEDDEEETLVTAKK